MADFSKQYCELHLQEFTGDFDILAEAEKLPVDHYIPHICEGYGFIAIGKDLDGNINLAFHVYEKDEIVWKPYEEVIV
jgi:hypothetical protein